MDSKKQKEERMSEEKTQQQAEAQANEATQEGQTAETATGNEEAAGQEQPLLSPEEQLQKELEQANATIEEQKDKYLRLSAEFDNYRKRTMKEKTELILNGGEKTISAILPVLDDFERALADKSEDPKAIKEGVQMIFNKFIKTLEGLGVKKIETADKDFDVDFHEAIAMVPGMGDDKKGKVIDCVQTGYTLNDKVIRHAKVAVGQ
ncbi:MAG: nucleotide exchange factor GrpE [Prevotella copri]|nr:nucleotide exchange factor GrpE [Segatella copri]